ncbi:MAG: DUF2480 family protein [Flavobacteriaceae bacterium]|nr:DUF2480 family protein [Flavobacteriaceae bacterium]
MENQIVNRIAKSSIVNIDLEHFHPPGKRSSIDLSQWLDQGFLLREKHFRTSLKNHDWQQYQDHYVALQCSTDAILPSWAYLLVTSHLHCIAKLVVQGTIEELEKIIYSHMVSQMDLEPYRNKPIMINGCYNISIPDDAYVLLVQRLQSVAKSIFFGESCSSVPLWKSKRLAK